MYNPNFGLPHTSEEDSFAILDRALEIKLTPEILASLDKIWPGPGGEAPEAYAW